MSKRAESFDLAAALATKGFTAGQRDIAGLVELIVVGDEPAATRAAPALAALGATALAATVARAAQGEAGARARLLAVIGLFARAGDAEARTALLATLADPETRARRAAIVALGKLGEAADDARTALLARWDAGDAPPDERRALAEALGKLGGDAARARLAALDPGADAELARRRDRAILMADRSAQRDVDSTIATTSAPPSPVTLRLSTRGGLAVLLAEELTTRKIRDPRAPDAGSADRAGDPAPVTDGVVQMAWSQPLAALFASRLWTALAIRLRLPAGDLAAAVTTVMTAASTRALLRALTLGAIRWRLQFASGHKRAVVWKVARDVTAAAPELVNDPTATTWDVLVDDMERTLDLVPRRLVDPRFAWRVAEVPAASHPTVAAALARLAEVRDGERVWDPFVGSGGELVECAQLAPKAVLIGTDIDPDALMAARANLDAATVTATLAPGDARTYGFATGTYGGHVNAIDLIISNPPLGSRVHVDAAALLSEALPNLVRQLAPRGRLVWITPATRKTTPVLEQLGLRRTKFWPVDLGGVRGHAERWER